MTYYMHILKDPKVGQKHITGRKFGTTCNFAKHLWEISRKYAKQDVPNAKDYGNDYCHKRPWRWTQVVLSRDKSVDYSWINQVSQIYSKNVTVQHKVGTAGNNIYQAGNSYRVKKMLFTLYSYARHLHWQIPFQELIPFTHMWEGTSYHFLFSSLPKYIH